MAIPDASPDGFLPAGVHECTLDEIDERFGKFQRSNCRPQLIAKLVEYLKDVRATGQVSFVILDGSFVTDKPEPNDIDLILVLKMDHDFAAEMRPFEYNALSRKSVRKRYAFDVLVARENSVEFVEYVQFFQQVRGEPHLRKGLLKVTI